mmetsp:Transcript_772/g.2335  ORF Transcript_772/g.2335 Transcript_772/m.2335 type:complete len:200 (-) Transcript_772:216-815(-)
MEWRMAGYRFPSFPLPALSLALPSAASAARISASATWRCQSRMFARGRPEGSILASERRPASRWSWPDLAVSDVLRAVGEPGPRVFFACRGESLSSPASVARPFFGSFSLFLEPGGRPGPLCRGRPGPGLRAASPSAPGRAGGCCCLPPELSISLSAAWICSITSEFPLWLAACKASRSWSFAASPIVKQRENLAEVYG